MALAQKPTRMTEAEYLTFERASETKHEYLGGEVFAMAGASRAHNLICSYTTAALINQLGERPCEVYQSDMRVKVLASGLYAYPDVTVVCGEPQFTDDELDTLLNPLVIIEVLAPSTAAYDRGQKLKDYRQIPTLQAYLLIAQHEARIERFMRQTSGDWLYTDVVGLENSLELPSLQCSLALEAV